MSKCSQRLAALALALMTGPVLADGFYLGAEAQQTRSYSEGDFCYEDSGDCDVEPTGYRVMLGFALTDTLAIEAGYMDGGDSETGFSDSFGSENISVNSEIVDLSIIGRLPLSDEFSLFGRFGAAKITNTTDFNASGNLGDVIASFDNDVTTYVYGVGLQFGWLVAGYDVYTDNALEIDGETIVEEDLERIYAGLKIGF